VKDTCGGIKQSESALAAHAAARFDRGNSDNAPGSLWRRHVSVPICLVGSFVGPHILIPGIVHAILGGILLVACIGLWYRQCWARWLLILLSLVVALAIPIALVRELALTASIPESGAFFFLAIAALFALVALNLLTSAARAWFKS
jgi:hypothetical protein